MLLEIILVLYLGCVLFFTLGFMFWYAEDASKTSKYIIKEAMIGACYGFIIGITWPFIYTIDLLKNYIKNETVKYFFDLFAIIIMAPIIFIGKLILD